jgi:hypothetical protein
MNDVQRIKRRNLVAFAIRLTTNTPLAPTWQERQLLAQFVQGYLTIDQVLALLDGGVQATQASNVRKPVTD